MVCRYPDVLLMIEVGYKFRFFGNDAETAARVLGIFAYYNHNFLSASIPTFRLHVHVRRLVEAGYKVGVVRQTETAAIKAHGTNKSGPFTRGLSALYTRATLEAAEDLGGDTEDHVGRLHSYLMCIAEDPILQGLGSSKSKPANSKSKSAEVDDDKGGYYDARLGVVAVDPATGDVMFGDFKDSVMRNELEALLLTCAPAELLLATPLSAATEKVAVSYLLSLLKSTNVSVTAALLGPGAGINGYTTDYIHFKVNTKTQYGSFVVVLFLKKNIGYTRYRLMSNSTKSDDRA